MTYAEAKKIRSGDEVLITKTNVIMLVVETEKNKNRKENNNESISFLLSDGNWYGYKDVS